MPGDILNADIGFPHFTGGETTEDKIGQISNYLYMLLEQLRYNFGNIGPENFTESSITELTKIIEKPLMVTVKDLLTITADDGHGGTTKIVLDGPMIQTLVRQESEDAAQTAITQTAQAISFDLQDDENNQTHLVMTYAGTTIDSPVLNINGYVTFTNLSTAAGSTFINGANIQTGTIKATQLDTDAVTASKIKAGAVTASKIDSGAITTTKLASDAITGIDITGCNIYATGSTTTYAKMISTGYETYYNSAKKAFIGVNSWNSNYYPAVILYSTQQNGDNAYFELVKQGNDDVIWIGNGDMDVGLTINLTQGTYTWTGMNP